MKAIVFGSTGFIGSHVVEQLVLAKHNVTAVVRATSNTTFLQSLGIPLVQTNFTNPDTIAQVIDGHDIVYNCTANPKLHASLEIHRAVEVNLTRKIAQGAAKAKVKRFIQLSTVQAYGFSMPPEFINETYSCKPEFPLQQASLEREQVVYEVASKTGLDAVILRPANTIGNRDTASFFAKMFKAHCENKYPIVGGGIARFSCVDTRDIGRAMVWLGGLDGANGQTYLVKGFDISWLELKKEIDKVRRITAKVQNVPEAVAMFIATLIEWLTPYSKEPMLTRLAVRALTTTTLYDDKKLRNTGFNTKYAFEESVANAIADLESRR